jgi:hypothetical protein
MADFCFWSMTVIWAGRAHPAIRNLRAAVDIAIDLGKFSNS